MIKTNLGTWVTMGGCFATMHFAHADFAPFSLQITNAANHRINGLIHNTSAHVPYAVYWKQSLSDATWSPLSTFYGSEATNISSFAVPTFNCGGLFLQARTPLAMCALGSHYGDTVVMKRDRTIWAWGINDNGELGNGQWKGSPVPVPVTGFSNAMAIITPQNGFFTLALDANSTIWSWGMGYKGQLGRGNGHFETDNLPAPVPGLSNVVAAAAGCENCAAVKSDGTVWTWGHGWAGKLGDGFRGQRDSPGMVPGLTNVIMIAAGSDHVLALSVDGSVWAWGYNKHGELGVDNTDDQLFPIRITELSKVVALAGGDRHSIALLSDGTVRAWGHGAYGQLGNGDESSSSTPVIVSGLSNIVAVASGGFHNLALDTNGNLYEWGDNSWNQLGNDVNQQADVPVLLAGVSNVVAVAAGEYNSAVMTLGGDVFQWGVYGYANGNDWRQHARPFRCHLYDTQDTDGDGLPNWFEIQIETSISQADSDSDGVSDFEEVLAGTDPLNPDSH
jgi:alpha-tubulin suppressor-like RCC1 family protein